jgi:hypothetical protein
MEQKFKCFISSRPDLSTGTAGRGGRGFRGKGPGVRGKATVLGGFSAAIFNLLLKKNMVRVINPSKNPLSL